MRIQRIQKRDGREVPYDRKKIEGAVERAESAVGERRSGFAAEIGDLVEGLLERRFPDPALAIPGIEDIQDLVERALVEMGATPVAKAYILYREKRAQIRTALLVREPPGDARGDARRRRGAPRVEARDGVGAWSKGRIVAALMSEADLSRASAEEVAARVEARVFASGSRSISTALVRELVDNELVELGYEGALRRQRPIGIPRHDLRRALLRSGGGDAARRDVEEVVAGEILSRYAIEDLLPPYVAERVRAGDLDFEDVSRPHLPLAASIPLDILVSGSPGSATAFRLLPEIGSLARRVARCLALEGAEPWIADLAREEDELAGWLAGLGAVAQASARDVELVLRAPRPAVLETLLGVLARLEHELGRAALPRIVLDQPVWSKASAATRQAASGLLRAGVLAPCWSAESERYAGPGLARSSSERGGRSLGAAATINLPRLARRAGAWREDAVFEALLELLEVALDGLAALRDFQREARDAAAPRSRASFAVSPVGLREALAILGDGDLREDQAARLVGFLVEASERLAEPRGLSVALTPRFGERSAARFTRLDAAQLRVRQSWLFAEPDTGEAADARVYGCGFDVPAGAPLLAALGAVSTCDLFPASALRHLASASSTDARDESARAIESWENLHRLRGRPRGAAHALYALPPLFRAHVEPAADLFAPSAPVSPVPPVHAET